MINYILVNIITQDKIFLLIYYNILNYNICNNLLDQFLIIILNLLNIF